jgi:CBS domain-containing protein
MAATDDNPQEGQKRETDDRNAGTATGRAMGQGIEATGRAMRHGLEATQHGTRSAGMLGRGAIESSGAMIESGMRAASEETRHFMEESARDFGEATRRLSESAERTMADLGNLMNIPAVAGQGVREMQQAATGLVARVMQTNARAVQDLFRLAQPTEVMTMQHRVMQQYLRGLVEASAGVLEVTRRVADDALQPIEGFRGEAEGGRSREGRPRRRNSQSTVRDVMTRDVEIADPNQTVREAARLMAANDTGALPVGEDDKLVGMITDRDIAVRVAAEGRDPEKTHVRDVMTPDIRYVFEDEGLDRVAVNMAEQRVRRLPVMDRNKRLVGIVSLGDLARENAQQMAGRALQGAAQEGGPHESTLEAAGSKPSARRPRQRG